MRHWIARLACLLGGILASLLLCEGVVRVAGLGNATVTRGSLHAYDPQAGWKCRPDCDTDFELPGVFRVRVHCNSAGLRDRERTLAAPPGVRRFIALGDSFMWGFGVENDQMFTSRLEGELQDTEVLNFGANGYSTVQELVRLEEDGLAYAPDAAILSFCWNDLDSNSNDKDGGRPAASLGADGTLTILNRPVRKAWKSGATQWLRHNSRLFSAVEYVTAADRVRHRMQASADAAALRADAAASGAPAPAQATDDDADPREDDFTLLDLFGPPTPAVDRAWDLFAALLTRIRDRMAGQGGRFVVMFVAIKEARSEQSFRDAVIEPFERDDRRLDVDRDRPARRLRAICDGLGVPFVDLNPVFRADGNPDALFLQHNGHWSAAGHALAAATVAGKLAECGLAVRRPTPAPPP